MSADVSPSHLGPASRDREARERSLIEAATVLFAEEGYGGASTRAIADRAGCSETLLFRYFGDKRGLLLAIVSRATEQRIERRRGWEGTDVRTCIEQHMFRALDYMAQNANEIRVIASAIVTDAELAGEFEQLHDESVQFLASQLAEFQRAGAIAPDVDLSAIATAVEQTAFSIGLLLQNVYGKPSERLRDVVITLARTLSDGMARPADATGGQTWRVDAVQRARDAGLAIERLVDLLSVPEPTADRRRS